MALSETKSAWSHPDITNIKNLLAKFLSLLFKMSLCFQYLWDDKISPLLDRLLDDDLFYSMVK